MNNQAYYRIPGRNGCDIALHDRHVVVNCSGVCVLSEPFTSRNRRSDYYLMYLVQGELEMEIRGRAHSVPAGCLVIYPPGAEYRYTKRGQGELVYYWAHFTGFGARSMLDGCGLQAETLYTIGVLNETAGSFRMLFQDFISSDGCSEVSAAAQLAAICARFGRAVGRSAPPHAARIQKSLEHIHRHYDRPITIPELAEIEHLSVSYYCAVFKRCMGVSPQGFIVDLRLKMAADLMQKTDLSLKQIARTVGYEDQLYFSRLFKSRKGVSPRSFAAKALGAR